jgi:mannose-1-phosphate guanylyltransferase
VPAPLLISGELGFEQSRPRECNLKAGWGKAQMSNQEGHAMASVDLPVYPVLLAGGSGTRLWPVSRELYPKQLAKLIGKESLIQSTLRRLVPPFTAENVRVVCGEQHAHEIARHMEEVGIPASGRIITEPAGRNTAPAILLVCLQVRAEVEDAVVGVFPADHVIGKLSAFHAKLAAAMELAAQGRIVTFGITPHYPETGYGYVEAGTAAPAGSRAIRRFVEKPDLETARCYLADGNFFWNSGMFAFRASVILDEFRTHQPGLLQALQRLCVPGQPVGRDGYRQLPDLSIDYAIMEKTDKGVVLPSDFDWSDIGSWKSLYDFLPKDADSNVLVGDVIAQETRNCFVMAYERLIATNRLQNLVVVETPDSIFVSDLDSSRDVKSIVAELKQRGRTEHHQHLTRHFPWGTRTLLDEADGYRTSRLVIYPRSSAKLEEPAGASVHLFVLRGCAKLSAGRRRRRILAGESVTLPASSVIHIENPQDERLQMVQVAVDGGSTGSES